MRTYKSNRHDEFNLNNFVAYLLLKYQKVEQGKLGIQKMQKQSELERLTELILLGMRTQEGISSHRWNSIASPNLQFNKVFQLLYHDSKASENNNTLLHHLIQDQFIAIDNQ